MESISSFSEGLDHISLSLFPEPLWLWPWGAAGPLQAVLMPHCKPVNLNLTPAQSGCTFILPLVFSSYCCALTLLNCSTTPPVHAGQDAWKVTGDAHLHVFSCSPGDKSTHSTYDSSIIPCSILLIASLSRNRSRNCLTKFLTTAKPWDEPSAQKSVF